MLPYVRSFYYHAACVTTSDKDALQPDLPVWLLSKIGLRQSMSAPASGFFCLSVVPPTRRSCREDRRPWRQIISSSPTTSDYGASHLGAVTSSAPSSQETATQPLQTVFHIYTAMPLLPRHSRRVQYLKLATYLPSPPASPSFPPSIPTSLAYPSNRARLACPSPSFISRASRLQQTPYPPRKRQDSLPKMSHGPYAWSSSVKTEQDQFSGNPQMAANRRSGSGDQETSFPYGNYPQVRCPSIMFHCAVC